jgi:hypothetical protein
MFLVNGGFLNNWSSNNVSLGWSWICFNTLINLEIPCYTIVLWCCFSYDTKKHLPRQTPLVYSKTEVKQNCFVTHFKLPA